MYVSLYDIKPLIDFIDLVYDSSKSIKLVFNEDGLKINLLNDSHIAFYGAEYKRTFFEVYEIDGVEELLFDTKDIHQILKSSKNDNELMIRWDDGNVEFIFESDNNRRVFEVGLIDEDYQSPVPPSIDYDYDFLMNWESLSQCCTDLLKIVGTDRFIINCKDDGLYVTAPVSSMTGYEYRLSDDAFEKEIKTIINADYLNGLSKLKKHGDLLLEIGDNVPVGWSVDNGLDVKFSGLIAPIFEEED